MKHVSKVLVVEDEHPLAKALELKLSHQGFDVLCAPNGEEGLKLLEKSSFDVILLDLIMPLIDGFKVLEILKEKKIKTPVIVLSNLSQNDDEQRARKLGAIDFFIKSNTPIADIVARVTHQLKKT